MSKNTKRRKTRRFRRKRGGFRKKSKRRAHRTKSHKKTRRFKQRGGSSAPCPGVADPRCRKALSVMALEGFAPRGVDKYSERQVAPHRVSAGPPLFSVDRLPEHQAWLAGNLHERWLAKRKRETSRQIALAAAALPPLAPRRAPPCAPGLAPAPVPVRAASRPPKKKATKAGKKATTKRKRTVRKKRDWSKPGPVGSRRSKRAKRGDSTHDMRKSARRKRLEAEKRAREAETERLRKAELFFASMELCPCTLMPHKDCACGVCVGREVGADKWYLLGQGD